METTNSATANNALTSMMDGYKKQLNLMTEFYTNAINSFSEQNKNMWNPMRNQSSLFFNNDALKSLNTPSNGFGSNTNISNPFMNMLSSQFSNPFDNMIKQVLEYNQNLVASLTKAFDVNNTKDDVMSDNYKKLVEGRSEASKAYINELTGTFNKQMESILETNKKLQEDTNKQFESVLKSNKQFWEGVLNVNETPPPLPNFSKNGEATEIKKEKMFVKA